MRVAIVGTGYVGLVTGACLAELGHRVVCLDRQRSRIESLREGVIPIFEPGLDQLVRANAERGRLFFTWRASQAVQDADVVLIAVGTPPRPGDGYADLTQVYAAARSIAPNLRDGAVVAVKSTVPIGTGDELERILGELLPDANFAVVSNPEFLREGSAIADFMRPDRIVVGAADERARTIMEALYAPLAPVPLLHTSRETAEMIKYASNAFLAAKVTFMNELADLCEQVGAQVDDVARGMGLDPRIGPHFLRVGPGFGGSCFPKDTLSLVKTAQDHGVTLRIVEAVAAANDMRKRTLVRKVVRALGGKASGKKVAVLGLTFKPGTDDVRDSPAIALIAKLCELGAEVCAYDPAGMTNAAMHLPALAFCNDAYACAEGADALVIMTEWAEFANLDLLRLKGLMAQPAIVDLRNLYDPADVERLGFRYDSIGRAAPQDRTAAVRQSGPLVA